jgi:hypothetical protein
VEKLAPKHRLTGKTRRVLGVCLARLRHLKEAEALLLQSYRELSANPNWLAQRDATESAQQLAEFYTSRGRLREAARYRTLARATQLERGRSTPAQREAGHQ